MSQFTRLNAIGPIERGAPFKTLVVSVLGPFSPVYVNNIYDVVYVQSHHVPYVILSPSRPGLERCGLQSDDDRGSAR